MADKNFKINKEITIAKAWIKTLLNLTQNGTDLQILIHKMICLWYLIKFKRKSK